MTSRRSLRRIVLAVLAVLAVSAGGLGLTSPASAHPFGAPQTADITSTDSGVRVSWKAAPDDVTALAVDLGVLAEMRTFVFKDGAMVPEESDASDGVVLAASPAFGEYMLARVAVTAAGTPCTGTLMPIEDVADGAVLDFDCGGPVSAAEVKITTMIDLNEAYRTLATGPFEQKNAYSVNADTFTWEFEDTGKAQAATASEGDPSPKPRNNAKSAVVQLGSVGAVVVVGGVAVFVWRRRTRARA